MDNKKIIGKRLQSYRKSLNITQSEFCERAQISSNFLSELERGNKGMSVDTLYNICKGLNIGADDLLFGTERRTVTTPLDRLIQQIPSQYTGVLEKMVQNLLETIRLSESLQQEQDEESYIIGK